MKHLMIVLGFMCLSCPTLADTLSLSIDELQTWNAIGSDGEVNSQGNAVQERIMGKPDFVKVIDLPANDANVELSKKVGFFMDVKRKGFCSGSLVGPDLFLTNHHCIAADNGGIIPATNIVVWMEYTSPKSKPDANSTAQATQILSYHESLDYALLKLNKPLGNRYGWLQLEQNPNLVQQIRSVKIIQHPDSRPKEIVTNNTQVINCQSPFTGNKAYLCYLADTQGGSSGSPVFSIDGDKIVALHHRGVEGRFNLGTRILFIAEKIKPYLPVAGASTSSGTSNNATPAKTSAKPNPAAAPKAKPTPKPADPPSDTQDNTGGWKPII